jgi:dCMP deaminase
MSNIDRPSWDNYYMDMTFYISQKSLDPATKHGCIVVDSEHTPLSMGFNSPPRGCIDEDMPLTRPEKYPFMLHAEENAIINAARNGISLKGSTFYITGHPCHKCFRMILNVGAKTIIYGPVNSNCVSKEDLDTIKLMNKRYCPKSKKIVKQIELLKWENPVGEVLSKALNYIKEKVENKV